MLTHQPVPQAANQSARGRRIVVLDHHHNPPDERATGHLKKLGFEVEVRCPARGDALGIEEASAVAGTLIFGGLHNVHEMDKYPFLADEIAWIRACHGLGVPLLGICLGAQLIAYAFGGGVSALPGGRCEFGYYAATPTLAGRAWMPHPTHVTQAHFYQFDPPPGATLLARGEHCAQAFRCGETTYGVQFHPEATPQTFRRWQDAEWAFFDSPGAQSRDEQNKLQVLHDAAQRDWFSDFIERLFGHAPAA